MVMDVIVNGPDINIHFPHSKTKMSVQEFKEWVNSMDKNKDGVISKEELREALRGLGLWFTGWKSWRGMCNADLNRNGVIDGDAEMKQLIAYAQKRWGIIIHQGPEARA